MMDISEKSERTSAFRAFSHKEFRRFYVGSIASQIGFWFSHISYQALMADLTNDELWVSLLFVVTFLPVLAFGPLGGLLADRLDRKKLLLSTYAALILVSCLQVGLVVTDAISPIVLLSTSFLIGIVMAVLGPVVQAVTANTVPHDDLSSAISLQAMASNASRVIGPALCAPLISNNLYEVSWSLYGVCAALALLVAAGITLFPYDLDPTPTPIFRSIADGVAHAKEKTEAWQALLLVGFISVFGVSHVALSPSFTANNLGRASSDFAWLGVATGFGALIGALAAGSFTAKSSLRRGALFASPYCILLLIFSRVTDFSIAMLIQVLVGFFYMASFTTLQVVVQELVAEEFRGRVMSLFQIAWAGLVPVGTLIMGLTASSKGLGFGAADTIGLTSLICLSYISWVVAREIFDASRF
jgi:MFS family permease